MTSLASVALPAAYNRVRLGRSPIGRLVLLAPRRRSEDDADERRMASLASGALPAAYNRVCIRALARLARCVHAVVSRERL